MTRLDYSKLIHRNEKVIKGYSVRNSFYMQKGNGRAGSYRGTYLGDYSVFRATRQTQSHSVVCDDTDK